MSTTNKRTEAAQKLQEAAEAYRNAELHFREVEQQARAQQESNPLYKEAKKARKRELRESANRMGFQTKQARRILEFGRSAFDPAFNSREHGVRPIGPGLGTLPLDAA